MPFTDLWEQRPWMESSAERELEWEVSGRLLYTEDNGDPGAGIEDQTGRDYEKRSRFRDDRGEE